MKPSLTFKDGKKVKDLKNLTIGMNLYVPDVKDLALSNKYELIRIEEGIQANMKINLYSGRIEVGDLAGPLSLEMKYSKGSIGNFAGGKLDLYDCKIDFGNAGQTRLNSKYSEITLKEVEELKIESYDDNISTGNIKGNLAVTAKYSDLEIGNFGPALMDLYDSNIKGQNGDNLQIKSKYSKLELKQLNNLNFELSYDDKIAIENLGSLTADAKYTDFLINVLKSKLNFTSFDNKLVVKEVTGPLEEMIIDGKYGEIRLDFDNELDYRVEANLSYGKLEYPEDQFDIQIYKEKHELIEIQGKKKGATDDSPKLKIDTYDVRVVIN